jgi:hypothetical protein
MALFITIIGIVLICLIYVGVVINKEDNTVKEKVKDIEYALIPDGENTWHIVDENGKIIDIITKDNIINLCKTEYENNHVECVSAEVMIDNVWWNLEYDYNLEFVDNYCQEFDKFLAWFDYVCVEYLTQELVAIYKRRLLNFE